MDNLLLNQNQNFGENNTSFNSNPNIKPFLWVAIGVVVGAIIVSIFIFFYLENKSEDKDNVKQVSQEVIVEINNSLQEELKESFSVVFGGGSMADIYIMKKDDDSILVSAVMTLSKEQFAEVFKTNVNEIDSENLKNTALIVLAEYIQEDDTWILNGDIKVYQGIDLILMQKSLEDSQKTARNSSIKAELSSTRVSAEMYAMDNNDSYLGFCSAEGFYSPAESKETIEKYGSKMECRDSINRWAAFAYLLSSSNQCHCVDYTGVNEQIDCPTSPILTCP